MFREIRTTQFMNGQRFTDDVGLQNVHSGQKIEEIGKEIIFTLISIQK